MMSSVSFVMRLMKASGASSAARAKPVDATSTVARLAARTWRRFNEEKV
jgi:hypothetical protein